MNQVDLLATLRRSDAAVRAALVALYANQSADEQARGETQHRNGAGFNASDAPFGTSLARQIEAGRPLSARQLDAARRMLQKYTRQLRASGVAWERWGAGDLQAMELLAAELTGGAAP